MFRIAITGTQLPHVAKEIEALSDIAEVTFQNCNTREELLVLTHSVDAIMTDDARIDRDVLNRAENLRVVVEYGIGVDNIDVAAATEKKVLVCNVPDVFIHEVAEHAVALMLATAKNIDGMNRQVQERHTWDFNTMPSLRLYGKTLGLIGCGNIGRAVGRIAMGMGMQVLAYDAFLDDDAILDAGFTPSALPALLSQANVVSLHVPHTPQTHHMIDAAAIDSMVKGAILVNVSRGGIVDEEALASALQDGRLFGAGVDVLEGEPDVMASPLVGCPNLLMTPHIGWKSELAAEALEMAAVREVRSVLCTGKPIHLVNKSLLSH